jgi:uncharacterized protein (DUF305 family)
MRKALLSAALATMTITLSASAIADQAKTRTDPQSKQMPGKQADSMFVMHIAQHHRNAIAMADAVIANGASDEVKTMARRIKSEQQRELAKLEGHKAYDKKMTMPPQDPSVQQDMAQLKAAKGAEADRLFLELMVVHHATGLMMSHYAKPSLGTAEVKAVATEMFGKQAREIGELQRLRESTQSARR